MNIQKPTRWKRLAKMLGGKTDSRDLNLSTEDRKHFAFWLSGSSGKRFFARSVVLASLPPSAKGSGVWLVKENDEMLSLSKKETRQLVLSKGRKTFHHKWESIQAAGPYRGSFFGRSSNECFYVLSDGNGNVQALRGELFELSFKRMPVGSLDRK